MPTYMKDIYEYGHDIEGFVKHGFNPTRTLQNKMHPLISTVAQMLNNENFYGEAIRNPSSPLVEQVQDEAVYLLKSITPFSIRNYEQQAKLREEEESIFKYLTSPAFVGITPSPGYIAKSEEQAESGAISANMDAMTKKFRQAIKDGADRAEVVAKMQRAGFTKRDILFVLKTSGDVPRPSRLRFYGEEPTEEE